MPQTLDHGEPPGAALDHIARVEKDAAAAEFKPVAALREICTALVIGDDGGPETFIGYALARGGLDVEVRVGDEGAAERVNADLARLIKGDVSRGALTVAQGRHCRARITLKTGDKDLPPAHLAIEAAGGDAASVIAGLVQLEAALPASSLLASNSVFLPFDALGAALHTPCRVIGMHLFNPAHLMRVAEIVGGEETSAEALASAAALMRRLGKLPVLCGACDGVIGVRLLRRYREAADTVLMDGATPWDVDEAMTGFGFSLGPYEAQDLAGLDIAYADRKRRGPLRDPARRYIPISDRMVEEGRLGWKTAVGWYRYPGGEGKVIDPLVEDLIREEAHFARVIRRTYSHADIRDRLLCALINEAAAILEEGIAGKPADIDLVTVHGIGFPRARDGLMFYADEIGAAAVLEMIEEFAREDPVAWKAAPLLRRLAQNGGRFAEIASGAAA